jgi:N-terminal domain of anti-restriction factor ArdC/IrrE N-terminal-like domain
VEQNPNEKVRKIAEEALDRLAAQLEAGKSETLKNYLAAMGRFHRYSWGNILLINSQRSDATHVAGFQTWRDIGRSVKEGEKGIMILAPVLAKQKDQVPAAKEVAKTDEVFRLAGFRTAYVFDVSQTDGKPLPEFAKTAGDPNDYTEKLKALVVKQGISVEYDPSIAPALGMSSGGRIRIVPGLSPAEEFSVLAHELAHEMLHHQKDAVMPPKIVRETQAEAVAYVVCRGVGLETNTAAADYIALYKGDKKTLAESLSVIQRTSAEILDELLPEKRINALEERRSSHSTAATMEPSHRALAQPSSSQAPTPENLTSPSQDLPVWDR